MTDFHIAILCTTAVVLVLGLTSGLFKSTLPLSEPMVAIAVGAAVGPWGFGWLRLEALGDPHVLLEQVARLTIAVAVVTAAVRLPRGYFTTRKVLGPLLALGPGMLVMWGVSSLLAWLILGVPGWTAVLIGAIVTPTDPVLAGSIVTGRLAESKLPKGVRSLVTGESGANDGLGYAFVWLPLLMLAHPPGEALRLWLVETWLWEILAAVAVGLAAGWIASWLANTARRLGVTGETSLVTMTLALAFVAVSAVKLMGSDGILAAFCAGAVFRTHTTAHTDDENEQFQEAAKRFFELPVFVLFGAFLPVEAFLRDGWMLFGLALAVILLRRPPGYWLLTRAMPQTPRRRDRAFVSWFGPVGIAALFYAMVGHKQGAAEIVWHATAATVLLSAAIHGITATIGTRAYAREEGEPPR